MNLHHILQAVDEQMLRNGSSDRSYFDVGGFLGAMGDGDASSAPPSRLRAVQLLQEINRLRNERAKLPITDERDRYELGLRIGRLSDEFGDLVGSRGAAWLTPSYPLVSLDVAKLLVLGTSPLQIATMADDRQRLGDPPELTKAEAHEWMVAGAPRPVMSWWLTRYLPAGADLPRLRSWRVAKWLRHVNDRGGWGALLKERQVHGPAGQTGVYRYIDKIDEIQDEDLVRGPRTSVDAVFEHAAERAGAAWTEKALKDHRVLNTLPPGWELPEHIRLLDTPAKLAREGAAMEHCVGGYAGAVQSGQSVILAVEVPGKCRSTAELTRQGKVLQHRGPKNADPIEPCKTIFDEFVTTLSPLRRLSGYKPDGAELAGVDLSSADLEDASFKNANLRGANLEKANLRGANLEKANLRGANLQRASLTGAVLENANLEEADLEKAILAGANLEKANLRGANLQRANLTDAVLENANLQRADLRGAYLSSATFRGAALQRADLRGTALDATVFQNASMQSADLTGAFVGVSGAKFEGANLQGAKGEIVDKLARERASRMNTRQEHEAARLEAGNRLAAGEGLPYTFGQAGGYVTVMFNDVAHEVSARGALRAAGLGSGPIEYMLYGAEDSESLYWAGNPSKETGRRGAWLYIDGVSWSKRKLPRLPRRRLGRAPDWQRE